MQRLEYAVHASRPLRYAREFAHTDQITADAEHDGIAARQAPQRLEFHAQMREIAGVLRRHLGPIRSPVRIVLRRGVESRMDGHGPIQAPHGSTQAQIQEVLECAVEHVHLVRERHRTVPLLEGHADVEIERPVGLCRDHAGLGPQVAVALIHDDPVSGRLARDEFERRLRQAVGVAEAESPVDLQRPVDPVPLVALPREREVLRVIPCEGFHDQFQAVPLGAHHVRQRLEAQRFGREHERAFAALGDVMLIDVDREFGHGAGRPGQMRLEVHRVHVVILGKRQRKPADRGGTVAEREVAAKGLVGLELSAHL